MKPDYKKYLCSSLIKITNSLREIDDPDSEWRVFLEKTLVESYIDNNQHAEASKAAIQLLNYIETNNKSFYDEFFEFMVKHDLISQDDLLKVTPAKWELMAIYRMEKLKGFKPSIDTNTKIPNPTTSVNSIKGEEGQVSDNKYIINELDEIYRIILPSNKPTSQTSNNHFLKASSEDSTTIFKR